MADASFPVAIKYEVDEQQLQLEFFGTNKDSGKRDSTIVSLPLGVAEELGFRLQREARPLLTALLLAKKKDGEPADAGRKRQATGDVRADGPMQL